MTNYLERYLDGEYEQVWHNLVSLDDKVQYEPLRSEAIAVARETMKRALLNLEMLVSRLQSMGYRFINPTPLTDPTSPQELDQFEKIAPLPLSIRAWYEIVGEVDFAGSHPTLAHSRSHKYYRENPPHFIPYPIPDRFSATQQERLQDPYKDRRYSKPFSMFSFPDVTGDITGVYSVQGYIDYPYRMYLCLDVWDQAGESGDQNWIDVSRPTMDVLLVDQGVTVRRILFVDYLREVFQWGGFPGYAQYVQAEAQGFSWGIPPLDDIKRLAQGLLPI